MNKYFVAPKEERTYQGIVFSSKLEMNRYIELFLLQKTGEITNLRLQPKYVLIPAYTNAAGKKVQNVTYVADFEYFDNRSGSYVVEDCKGYHTPIFKLKQKIFEYKYPDKVISIYQG